MIRYDNKKIRRQDRLLEESKAMALLDTGEYGFLSLCVGDEPYGIPMSYARDENSLYFHCAMEGRKLNMISENRRASFCVVGATAVQSAKFTTLYESIVLEGNVLVVSDSAEKQRALELILDKYSPSDKETGLKYTAKSFYRTTVLRFDIESMSGKTKK